MTMDATHDQNFMCKVLKIMCTSCVFCCTKYPLPICILFLFLVSYLFFPWVFTFLIFAFPLAGFSFLVHRVFLSIDNQKIKHVEKDDKRKKFAKSRRSFKSIYGDRSQLIRRNKDKSDDYDTDDIFSKSLKDLLLENKITKEIQEVDFKPIIGNGKCSSLNGNIDEDEDDLEGKNWDVSEDENEAVRWTECDQKNVMDLGLSEAERNKRLESLMVRRRSRRNLGYEETSISDNVNAQISAIKTTKINPFLEDRSCGKKSPGSAPSSLVTTHNPFDLPYDPYEEKLDLTGDDFHEEFNMCYQKESIFCRHESFSLGGLSHPETAHDKHEMSFYKDLVNKQKPFMGLGTSTFDNRDESSKQEAGVHPKEDESERKADIVFFYGGNKRVGHASSQSMVSDLQVEVSDEGLPTLDDLDIEKDKESWLNSSNQESIDKPAVSESNHAVHDAPNGSTELAVGQAHFTTTSPKSFLRQEYSADPASPYNFANEVQDRNDRQL